MIRGTLLAVKSRFTKRFIEVRLSDYTKSLCKADHNNQQVLVNVFGIPH